MNRKIVLAGAIAAGIVSGAANAERGSDGQLNIIYWQAASILNPYLSSGTKDIESASMVIEPLARYNEKGNMVPLLVDEIPTVDNGGISVSYTHLTLPTKRIV